MVKPHKTNLGADEAVQNQGSNHTNGQAASVNGDNVDATQDSVNYGQQTQLGCY